MVSEERARLELRYIELARQELFDRILSGNLLALVQYLNPTYLVNWHHALIANYLTRFIRKEITRLMIFAPPQHGKSDLVSRYLPAMLHGVYNSDRILAASYNASLASEMTVDVQRIMDLPRYGEIFPESKISPPGTSMRYQRNSSGHELIPYKDHRGMIMRPPGRYSSAGVDGAFTGKTGDWLLIDDPYKSRADADSKSYRDFLFKNYSSVLKTRLRGEGSIVLMHTRWHEDDLAAKLLKLAKDDREADQWVVLSLPAILESETERHPDDPRQIGEALWPGRFPLSVLRSHRSTSLRDFSALYQQKPTPDKGTIFKRDWIQYYRALPAEKPDASVQSWDMSFKDSANADAVSGQVWHRYGGRFFLDHQAYKYGQMDFPTTVEAFRQMTYATPNVSRKLVEDKANGPAVIATLKSEIPGIIPVQPNGTKIARASAVSTFWEAGNVFLPDPSIAPWVSDYVEELVAFRLGAEKDDRVDAMSQAINDMRLNQAAEFSEHHVPDELDAAIELEGEQW